MTSQVLTLPRWVWANIRFKPLSAVLAIFLMVTGLSLVLTATYLRGQIENRFVRDMQGIDLVVSGKGSPLQIVLSSVFHLDTPTGNIPLASVDLLKKQMLVKNVIPVSLGDNYDGYRIVGTHPDYIKHYKADFSAGDMFEAPMDVVLGSLVAHEKALQIGNAIVGAHGLTGHDDLHASHPYTVVGILKPTGTVLDRLVMTPLESVWQVHGHEHHRSDDGHEEEAGHDHHHDEHGTEEGAAHPAREHLEVTALLITYKSPLATAQMPRLVNSETDYQAASPVFEMTRLNKLMGTGEVLLKYFGFALVCFAIASLLIASLFTVRERYYDIALLRAVGASRRRVFGYVVAEVAFIAAAGVTLSGLLTYVLISFIAKWLMQSKNILIAVDISLLDIRLMGVVFVVAVLAGAFAAFKAYRLNVIRVLTRGV
jgi:putative ABC transport system permease protein